MLCFCLIESAIITRNYCPEKQNVQPYFCAVGRQVRNLWERDAGLSLVHGSDTCELYPQIGGSIGDWTVQGQQMLRSASPASIEARDPFGMASFPLVPYCNRIGNGTFVWDGNLIALAPNFPPEPHAIHGVGFQRVWQVQARSTDWALLALHHQPDADWPWPFAARQLIEIADGVLTLHLSAINLAPHPAPLAFGHHPYFSQSGAHLTFRAQSVWLAGDDGLPSGQVAPFGKFDFCEATPVQSRDVDNCFTGLSEPAYITWQERPLALRINHGPELGGAVVYIRGGAEGFCFEPVPHIINALNLQGHEPAMPIVAPGETISAQIHFCAVTR
jgi:aldose 1-epimerase